MMYALNQQLNGPKTGGSTSALSSNSDASTNQHVPSITPINENTGTYKDGTYTGNPVDAFYGNIQVAATIKDGKISDIQFLQYPNDRRNSIEINTQAIPILKSEAIQAQNTSVDIVSGATDTSRAFIESLKSVLAQASK